MPATRAAIAEQILRFKDHPGFPDDQTEVAKAFDDVAIDNDHLKQIADQVMRTIRFGPVPGDVYAAADIVAEQRRMREAPSPYDKPGELIEFLTDGMSAADAARWEKMAQNGKTSQAREIAKVILARYQSTLAAKSTIVKRRSSTARRNVQ